MTRKSSGCLENYKPRVRTKRVVVFSSLSSEQSEVATESHHKSDNRPRVAVARALVGLKFRRGLALFRETQIAGRGFLRQSQVNESNSNPREIRAPASQPGIFFGAFVQLLRGCGLKGRGFRPFLAQKRMSSGMVSGSSEEVPLHKFAL
jgi:hypothetical protein